MKYLITFLLLLSPTIGAAQNQQYSTLLDSSLGDGQGLGGLVNDVFLLLLALAAIFAVIKIILAGVKYMLTDIVTSKESAKKDIKGALLGLIIIISAVFILREINPNLTDFNLNFVQPQAAQQVSPINAAQGNNANNAAAAFPCAVPNGPTPNSAGTLNIETLNVSNCNAADAAAALQAFADSCRSNPQATYSTSQNGQAGACGTPVQQTTTPPIEFALDSYAGNLGAGIFGYNLKDQYMTINGNQFAYDSVAQCDAETSNATDRNECLVEIRERFTDPSLLTDTFGFCTHNAARNCGASGSFITGELPTFKVKHEDLRDDYLNNASGAQGATWDLAAFRQQCRVANPNAQVVDISRADHGGSFGPFQNSLDDYRCVAYN